MGNVSVTLNTNLCQVSGSQRKQTGTLHLSSSYAVGGDAWTASQFGLDTVDELIIESGGLTGTEASGYLFQPTYATGGASGTIKAYATGAGAAVAFDEMQSGDLSATIVQFSVWGV